MKKMDMVRLELTGSYAEKYSVDANGYEIFHICGDSGYGGMRYIIHQYFFNVSLVKRIINEQESFENKLSPYNFHELKDALKYCEELYDLILKTIG